MTTELEDELLARLLEVERDNARLEARIVELDHRITELLEDLEAALAGRRP